ncbi:hypothetical protein A2U01_0117277, partial [Trifolium medium]|nr:hypothetical protein [Trifolium medium]
MKVKNNTSKTAPKPTDPNPSKTTKRNDLHLKQEQRQ